MDYLNPAEGQMALDRFHKLGSLWEMTSRMVSKWPLLHDLMDWSVQFQLLYMHAVEFQFSDRHLTVWVSQFRFLHFFRCSLIFSKFLFDINKVFSSFSFSLSAIDFLSCGK